MLRTGVPLINEVTEVRLFDIMTSVQAMVIEKPRLECYVYLLWQGPDSLLMRT